VFPDFHFENLPNPDEKFPFSDKPQIQKLARENDFEMIKRLMREIFRKMSRHKSGIPVKSLYQRFP
jgi:hypothetical protein